MTLVTDHARPICGLLCSAALLAIAGCPTAQFDDTITVILPADQEREADRGSGTPQLAGSVWAFYKAADDRDFVEQPGPYGGIIGSTLIPTPQPDDLMFRVEFGPEGELLRIFDNHFLAPDVLGDQFIYDGAWHATPIPGLSYAGAPYGAEIGAQVGAAALYDATFFGAPIATATAYAWGTVDGDRIQGIAGYVVDPIGLEFLFGDKLALQYTVYGIRE